jgi:hypothetical protein
MVRSPWKTGSLLGCDDEEKPQMALTASSAHEELKWKSEKRHKYLLNL